MSEDAYNKKLADLQQYIPFMENMIAQLKDPKWKPREAQLNKMESLYNMITDKNKKWKYDTLLKCEEVILKLQTKVKGSKSLTTQLEHQSKLKKEQSVATTVSEIMNVLKFNTARAKLNKMQESNETPKSPSPTPEDVVPFEPKIIPVEPTTSQESQKKFLNIIDPNELSTTWDTSLERYTKEKPDIYTSAAQSLVQKKTVFDRLGPVITDPAKPLLTDDDLAQLGTGVEDLYVENAAANQTAKDEMKIELNLKITPRIVPVPCSKPKCPKVDEKLEKKERDRSLKDRDKEGKVKTVKVDGNASGDIFGSLLSSIDTKIIQETKKKDHKKEHHTSGKHREEKDKSKDREHKHHSKKHEKSHRTDRPEKTEKPPQTKPDKTETREEKTQEDYVSSTVDIPMEKPKRLADKYHPKPRLKQPTEEVESTLRVEEKEEVKLNRDPRRRSPPLSMGFFNPNPMPNEDRQRNLPTESTFEQRLRPIEPIPNYDGRVDTGWPKYPPQASPDVMQGGSFNSFGRTPEHRYPSQYNSNNLGFPQDQMPHATPPSLRFEPPVPKFEAQMARFEPPQPRFEMPRYDNQQHYDHPSGRHFEHSSTRFDPRIETSASYNRFDTQPVAKGYMPALLPTPMVPGSSLPAQMQPPQVSTPQPPFQRRSFNPFEPLNSEKEKEEPLGGHFSKRGFGYNRYNFGNASGRPKFENSRSRFDRARNTFDRRERFGNNGKPFGNRRSLDEDEQKVVKTDSPTETFTSPLESLYSNPKPVLSAAQARAALDKFKIPKKKQEEKKEEIQPTVTENTEQDNVDTDSDEDTPLSRKIKRRLRIKIEDSDNESENEKAEISKTRKNSETAKKTTKKTKPGKEKAEKPKLEKIEKIEATEEEKVEENEGEDKPEVSVDAESPTRRLRTRPQRKTAQPAITQSPEKKRPPPRRSRRVTRGAASQKTNIYVEMDDQETEQDEKARAEGDDSIQENQASNETPLTKDAEKIVQEEDIKSEVAGTSTEADKNVPEKVKVTNELLADIKKTNLKMEDTDVLQFILQNYKKIKKIFRSDSSSEGEEESKKKKEKKHTEKRDISPDIKEKPSETKEIVMESETKPAIGEPEKDTVVSKAAEIKQAISVTKEQFISPVEGEGSETPKVAALDTKILDKTKELQEEKTTEVLEEKINEKGEIKESTNSKEAFKDEAPSEFQEQIKTKVETEDTIKTEEDIKTEMEPVINKTVGKKNQKAKARAAVQVRNKKKVKKVIVQKRVGRNTRLAAKSKKARRSELDKLHDDIKEMLMGSEIMSSSGKRSCTMVQKEEKVDEDSDETKSDIAKTNVKVILEKSDFGKLIKADEVCEEDIPPPVLEKMVVTPPPTEECRKKVVKRKSKWASGIIQKKVRKRFYDNNKIGEVEKEEEEDDDDDFEMSEVTEHDKKYFYVHAAKIGCKLCGFKGKLIVQHYRTAHPESEVLISRLDQEIAEFLINDSIKNFAEYDTVHTETKKLKSNFKCPFCLIIMKDTLNAYYNHLCSHTGEYRYGCYHCPYRTFNAPNVRTHISQTHTKIHKSDYKIIYPEPKLTKYIFGHLCSECNFIQFMRATVEEHSMVYHPGTPEIHKINLGALLQEEPVEENHSNLDDCINAVASGAGEIRNRNLTIPAEVKELNISDLLSQIEEQEEEEDEQEDELVRVKVEPRELEEDTRPIELAAFMCDADLDIENDMEDDRAKMSQWINENTRKARTSIADRLQIKLVSDDGNKPAAESEGANESEELRLDMAEMEPKESRGTYDMDSEKLINVPEPSKEMDPLDISMEEQIEQPAEPKQPENLAEIVKPPIAPTESIQQKSPPILVEKTKKQPELTSTVPFQKIDVMPQKKDICVSKIINRLQEKLTTPPPPKPNVQEMRSPSQKVFTNILDMGPIRAIRAGSTFTFLCKVPNCDFAVEDEKCFSEHCEAAHKDFVYVFSTGKCNVCSIKFEYEGKFVTVHDVYLHMMSAHKEFFKKDAMEAIFKLPHDVPNVLSQGSDSSGPKFPFVITNVTSLASSSNSSNNLSLPPPLIPFRTETANQDSVVATAADAPLNPEIRLPIIASVQSLAVPKPSQQAKQLTPIGAANSRRTLVLRDIPVKDHEKSNKKSPAAIAALMKPSALNALYKCPKYDCGYSTMFSISFQRHISGHPSIMSTLVPCLYCDYKVSCNLYVIHLEIRHGHCKFGCGSCFYRATCEYFVMLHREIEHPNTAPKILELKVLSFNNKASSDLTSPKVEDLILHYNCYTDGHLTCPFKTLYFEEYLNHAELIHQVNRTSQGKVILERWLEKGVGPFQCRYCKKATLTYQEMGKHQAVFHFQKECCFYYRKFVPTDTVVIPEQVDLDNPSFINNLVQLPDQVHLCSFKVAECLTTSYSTEPPEKVIDLDDEPELSERFAAKEPEALVQDQSPKISLLDEPEILALDDDIQLLEESDPLCLDEDVPKDILDDKMPAVELMGKALYKCNCGKAYDTMILLKSHIVDCVKKPYECVHCGKERKSVLGLVQHYREHGRRRFKCSLCSFKHWQQEAVRSHMRGMHNVTCAIALPAAIFIGRKADPESDDYVLRPRQTAKSINDINLKVSTVTTDTSTAASGLLAKLTFGPDDISKLPRQPIYTQPVKCAICGYETKVKTNMERHLQMHVTQNTVPGSAPVNPVPCLDKNEKMFDKMVNLASSSHVGGRMGGTAVAKVERTEESVPGYVPSNSRFVCGAEKCKYQCLEESMLRRHIVAFHSAEMIYKCIHCNLNLIEEKTINIDLVLKHLKLHDLHLYRCSACSFMHNLKHKVERHLLDKHTDKPQNLIVIRELKDPATEDVVQEKEKPWRCGICKFRCTDLLEIKSHTETKHNIDAKYKCALCPVRSDIVEDFTNHFNTNHEGQAVNFIVAYYKQGEAKPTKPDGDEVFNTTPLWQRHKSIKHIRGILLDESTSKVAVKRKMVKSKRSENDDEAKTAEDDLSRTQPVSPQQEVRVGRKRKMKQASKDGAVVDDVITIEDEDSEGKKSKLDETAKPKKRKLTIVDLNKLKAHSADESPKIISDINIVPSALDTLALEEETGTIHCDETINLYIDDPEDPLDRECPEKTIELPFEHTAAILEDLDKSILLDEAENVTANSEKTPALDVETVRPEEKKRLPQEEDDKQTRTPRTAKTRAFHNIVTTQLEDASKRCPRPKPKKFKPTDPLAETADEERADLTVIDVEKMTKEELLEGNLIGTYGPYGTPWEGKMKCPLCEKYMSRTESDFRYHLYEELQCAPYKCNLCDISSPSEEVIEKHTLIEHKEEGFTIQALDEQIEGWIRMTIAVQSRIVQLEERPQSSMSGSFLCLFCNYRSDKNELRQKHLIRHFLEKPFSCKHCGYSSLTINSLRKHLKCASYCRTVGNLADSIVVVDPANGFLINPYLKNWKKFTEKELQDLFDEDKAMESENVIKCYYCSHMGTVDQQTEHCQAEHPTEPPRIYRYKCNVCAEWFVTLVTLNHHYFVRHPGFEASFSMNDDDRTKDKFACEECRISFDTEDQLKAHSVDHLNVFKCIYCPQEFSSWRKIVVHVQFKHAGKEVLFKFMERDILKNVDVLIHNSLRAAGGVAPKKVQKLKTDSSGSSSRLSSPASTIEIQSTPPRQTNSSNSFNSVVCVDDSP